MTTEQEVSDYAILQETKNLLSSPGKWCQGNAALRKDGLFTLDALDPEAVAWCLAGALTKSYYSLRGKGERSSRDFHRVYKLLEKNVSLKEEELSPLVAYNDDPETTYDDVVTLLEKALENGEKEIR